MLSIDFIIKHINAKKIKLSNKLSISNSHFNSQEITPNGLFFAFTQGNRDGHLFIQNAIENGATSIILSDEAFVNEQDDINYFLVEDTYQTLLDLSVANRNNLTIPFVAITGSNGKTTTKDIVHHLLSSKYKVYKTPKNLNNHIGVPLSLLHIDNTYDFAVLELGMNHKGEIDFLAKLVKPDYSLITNIGDSHIEFLGSTENIARAKGELIPHTKRFIFINNSINHKDILLSVDKKKDFLFVSDDNTSADLMAYDYAQDTFGSTFKIENNTFYIPLKGRHNLQNTLLAMQLACNVGFSLYELKEPIESLEITDMRYQIISGKNNSLIINDAYNASPISMKASISTFMEEKGEKVIVLGDMFELGDFSCAKHREVGEFLNSFSEELKLLITVGSDSAYISSSYNGDKIHFSNKNEATLKIKEFLQPNNHLLFKASRGMKLETIINDCK